MLIQPNRRSTLALWRGWVLVNHSLQTRSNFFGANYLVRQSQLDALLARLPKWITFLILAAAHAIVSMSVSPSLPAPVTPFRVYLPRTKRSPSALAIRMLVHLRKQAAQLRYPPTHRVNTLFFFAFLGLSARAEQLARGYLPVSISTRHVDVIGETVSPATGATSRHTQCHYC